MFFFKRGSEGFDHVVPLAFCPTLPVIYNPPAWSIRNEAVTVPAAAPEARLMICATSAPAAQFNRSAHDGLFASSGFHGLFWCNCTQSPEQLRPAFVVLPPAPIQIAGSRFWGMLNLPVVSRLRKF